MFIKLNQDYSEYLPNSVTNLNNIKVDIPRIAKDKQLINQINLAIQTIPTQHNLFCADSRHLSFIPNDTVHLVLTSPPYWNLKKYRNHQGQLGEIEDFEIFLKELDQVWKHCYRVLVSGGRLVCVVGDVCLSRRKNKGRHTVIPLHSSIQEHCRQIGYDNLSPIIWYKISNAVLEASGNGARFLGKPYEPNAVIKNDIEFILMQRKPGGYRKPSVASRILSIISEENHQQWFQSIWSGVRGESTQNHPAPYPITIAERLIRMFSFVGDTVLDPFLGTGTTTVAAARWGRNSIGIEVDPNYFEFAEKRVRESTTSLFSNTEVTTNFPNQ